MEVTDYLITVVKPMLKHPDYLTVQKTHDDMGILLLMDLHKDDMGIIIGRSGETAKAIRHVVRIVGMTTSARVSVKINEPHKSG